MYSTFSQGSADFLSDSSARDFAPSPSARSIPIAEPCLESTGRRFQFMTTLELFGETPSEQLSSFVADSLVNHSAAPPEDATTPPIFGRKWLASSVSADRVGLSLKTSLDWALMESTGLPQTSKVSLTPSGFLIWTQRHSGVNANDAESFSWPTPTATVNHDCPSMRRWPAYARYQDAVKQTTPELWEWMMGFPAGWTVLDPSETPSSRKSPK